MKKLFDVILLIEISPASLCVVFFEPCLPHHRSPDTFCQTLPHHIYYLLWANNLTNIAIQFHAVLTTAY